MRSIIKSFLEEVVKRSKAFGKWLMDNSDPILRLTGTLAIVIGTWIAHNYEAKISAVTLLSDREQSESQLRASMFNNLITPIAGPQKDGEIQPHRERLLIELLALNFHEHFQFKPLMLHVDKRLSDIYKKNIEGDIKEAEYNRKSLRSIARRITQKQIKTLFKEDLHDPPETLIFELPMIKIEDVKLIDEELLKKIVDNKIVLKDRDSLYFYNKSDEVLENKLLKKGFKEQEIQSVLTMWHDMLIRQRPMIELKEKNNKDLFDRLVENKVALRRNENKGVLYFYNESKEELENKLIEEDFKEQEIQNVLTIWQKARTEKNSIRSSKSLNQMHRIEVPGDKDKRYLYVGIMDINSDNETVDVIFSINYGDMSIEEKFTITWYDFPFTDYSILPNGMRFSLVLDDMKIDDDTSNYKVNLKIIWYPKDYFTAHERPIKYKEFRKNVGI